ncbi:hypothetical protein Tco_0223664 [Tanacetum coccineum]
MPITRRQSYEFPLAKILKTNSMAVMIDHGLQDDLMDEIEFSTYTHTRNTPAFQPLTEQAQQEDQDLEFLV